MQEKALSGESFIVIAGIVAVFILFLLMLVVPFIDISPVILLFVVGLMGVVLIVVYGGGDGSSGREEERDVDQVRDMGGAGDAPESRRRDNIFDFLLLVFLIGSLLVSPLFGSWFNSETYSRYFLYCLVFAVLFSVFSYMAEIRKAQNHNQSLPEARKYFIMPLFRHSLVLCGIYTLAFFCFEIAGSIIARKPIPEIVLAWQVFLFVFLYLYCRIYFSLKLRFFGIDHGDPVINVLNFISLIYHYFKANLYAYLLAGIILNALLGLIIVLAGEKIITIDLTKSAGFVLFLLFAFGNLLLFALIMIRLDRISSQLPVDDDRMVPVVPGTAERYLNPRLSTMISGMLMFVFLIAFIAVPFVVIEYIFEHNPSVAKEVNITVEHSESSQFTVIHNGGKDAGSLLLLEAGIYGPDGRLIKRSYLGSDTSLTPISIGQKIVFIGSFPEGSGVSVSGHFSDGERQVLPVTMV